MTEFLNSTFLGMDEFMFEAMNFLAVNTNNALTPFLR